MSISSSTKEEISLKKFKEKVLEDYRTVSLSREISVQGRREVLEDFLRRTASEACRGAK